MCDESDWTIDDSEESYQKGFKDGQNEIRKKLKDLYLTVAGYNYWTDKWQQADREIRDILHL